jgi:uncharacterized protein (TIRG00374 family)
MPNSVGWTELRRLLSWRGTSILLTVLVVALGGVVVMRTMETDRVAEAVLTADLRLLVLAVGVYAVSWPLRGRRYDDILATMYRRCGVAFVTAAIFLSQTANLVVPARAGEGGRADQHQPRRGVSYATGGASLAVERLFDLLALSALGGLAGAYLVLSGRTLAPGETAKFLAGAALVAGVALVASAVVVAVARSDRELGAWIRSRVERPRLGRVVDAVVRFGGDVRVVAADPRVLAGVGAASLGVWALDVLTAVLVIAALAGGVLPVATLVAVGTVAVTVGNLAKVLPLSQGGIGLYEAAFTALVVAASPVGPAVALAAAVVDHGLKNALTLVGGAAAGVGLNTAPDILDRDIDPADPESSDF